MEQSRKAEAPKRSLSIYVPCKIWARRLRSGFDAAARPQEITASPTASRVRPSRWARQCQKSAAISVRQLPCPGTLDQREQGPEFFLGCDQRGKAGTKHMRHAADNQLRFTAQEVGSLLIQSLSKGHTGATSPELSRTSE